MPCYHPLSAYQHATEGGQPVFQLPKNSAVSYIPIQLPCGRCIGCRLGKSREWSVRCTHEASLHWQNCWLTLTLNDDYKNTRPNPYSVEKGPQSEITRFIKRLRKKFVPKNPHIEGTPEYKQFQQENAIRFLYCAEYGETCFFCNKPEKMCYTTGCQNFYPWRGRPHYHVCIFNHDFNDKIFFKTINEQDHYTSETLDALWTDPKTKLNMGNATISDLTPDSAAYTARYSLKKITGDLAKKPDPITQLLHYERIDPCGEIVTLKPEYINMSRAPGIGKNWLDLYSKEVLDNDAVLFKSLRIKPPRYYDNKLSETHLEIIEENKQIRLDKAKSSPDNTTQRLLTREYITTQKAAKLHRKEI